MAFISDVFGPSQRNRRIKSQNSRDNSSSRPQADQSASRREYLRSKQAAIQRIKQIHQATIIPTPSKLTMEPVKRMYRQSTGAPKTPPKPGHYKNFGPNPQLEKYSGPGILPAWSKPVPPKPPQRPASPAGKAVDISRLDTNRIAHQYRSSRDPSFAVPILGAMPTKFPTRPSRHDLVAASPQSHQATLSADVHTSNQRSKIFDFIQYPLIVVTAVGAAFNPTIGQAFIGVYFLLALRYKIRSQITFGAALLLLVSIPFFQVLQQTTTSENAAIYAYEMLVVGTVQTMIELWRDRRRTPRRVAPYR